MNTYIGFAEEYFSSKIEDLRTSFLISIDSNDPSTFIDEAFQSGPSETATTTSDKGDTFLLDSHSQHFTLSRGLVIKPKKKNCAKTGNHDTRGARPPNLTSIHFLNNKHIRDD